MKFHPHRFFVDGGRQVAAGSVRRWNLGDSRITPNHLTITGFVLCAVAAFTVSQASHWMWLYLIVGVLFAVGSLLDVLDGALAKAGGKTTPFGGVLDTFSDRVGEALMLFGIFYVFHKSGQDFGMYVTVLAIIASPLVSHARAVAEKLGLNGEKGLGDRMTRCTLIVAGLVFQPVWEHSLAWAVTAVGLIALETAGHRVLYIRQQQKGQATLVRPDTRRYFSGLAFLLALSLAIIIFGIDTPW